MTGLQLDIDTLDYAKGGGVVTVVAQDADTGGVLMVGHADRDALERTLSTGEMHYRSRSRGLWHKGATSGNVQRVVSLTPDCDRDVVLARVISAGPACHTGTATCFADVPATDVLSRLDATIATRAGDGSGNTRSYTRALLADRNLRLKKIGEEAAELVLAVADGDRKRAIEEVADLIYHALVVLRGAGAGLSDVRRELEGRERQSISLG